MFKKLFLSFTMCIALMKFINAQSLTCAQAAYQLQSYAQNVNAQYWYYYNNVGNFCGFNWQWCLGSLNTWYYNQCVYVNRTYATLSHQCTNSHTTRKPAPTNKSKHEDEIDTGEFDDLAQDIEENNTSRKKTTISIPSNPSGWRP